MALRWIEGFDTVVQETQMGRLYTVVQSDTPGTFAGMHEGLVDTAGAAGGDSLILRSPDLLDGAADENTWVAHFAFRCDAANGLQAATADPYFAFHNAGGEQIRLEFIDAGPGTSGASKPGGVYYQLRLMRGATTIAVSDQIFNADGDAQDYRNWTYFEFKAVVRTATNGSVEVRWTKWGGETGTITWDAAVTGINTADQATDGADRFELSWDTGVNGTVVYDDVVVVDSTGAKNNDFLGECLVSGMIVDGDGDTTDWTLDGGALSTEDALNEGKTTQNTTEDDKRLTSDTTGQIHLASLSDLNQIRNVPVVGVQARLSGRMEVVGSRDLQFFYRKTTGSPVQVGSKVFTVNMTALTMEAETLEDDPNTGTDWVVADIDGLQIGVELDA